MILKDGENELPIPVEWRPKLKEIVSVLASGNPHAHPLPEHVEFSPHMSLSDVLRNIAEYGEQLIELPDDSWETSIVLWMEGYWEVLVDLFTKDKGRSDLVLHAMIFENDDAYRFLIDSIHVP